MRLQVSAVGGIVWIHDLVIAFISNNVLDACFGLTWVFLYISIVFLKSIVSFSRLVSLKFLHPCHCVVFPSLSHSLSLSLSFSFSRSLSLSCENGACMSVNVFACLFFICLSCMLVILCLHCSGRIIMWLLDLFVGDAV